MRLRFDPTLFQRMTVCEAAAQAIEEIEHRREGVGIGNPTAVPSGKTSAEKPAGDPPAAKVPTSASGDHTIQASATDESPEIVLARLAR